MLAAYGFGLFPRPAYREARLGGWRVVRHAPCPAVGYVSGPAIDPDRCVLYHGRTAWMSTGLMEQESHAFHVHEARGVVVAAGLGLGMYAFAVSLRPEVERVVVVERSPKVIAIVRQAAAFEHWPGRDKVALLEADALGPELATQVAALTGGRRPDYLYADIWPACPAAAAPAETAAMVEALRPRAAGWWGQELSFGLWAQDRGRPVDEAALEEYFASTGVPVPAGPGYAAFCRDAIVANLPRTARPGKPRQGWRRLLAWMGRRANP